MSTQDFDENHKDNGDEEAAEVIGEVADTSEVADIGEVADGSYVPPISAIPPRVTLMEESQMEVSASPAFQCLDDLFSEGRLTGTRVAQLKARYSELHERLKLTRENEAKLLHEAKEYTSVLEGQSNDLEKADNFPEGTDTDVSRMRQQLLKYRNELAQIEERQYQHEYKIECLQEDRKLMQREYDRMPKKGEVEKKIKELQASCEELRREIVQRQGESKNLKEDLDAKRRDIQVDRKVFEEANEEKERLKGQVAALLWQLQRGTEINVKGDLIEAKQEPVMIAKDTDRYTRQKKEKEPDLSQIYKDVDEVEKKQRALDDDFTDKLEMLRNLENQRQTLEEEKYSADMELDKQRMALDEKQRAYDALMREHEYAREKEAQLMGDKAALDLSLRTITVEKKNQHEIVARKQREKDKDARNLKRVELQLKVAEDNLAHQKTIQDKVKGLLDAAPKDDGTLFNRRKELQKDVEQTKRSLSQQTSLTAVEQVKVEQSIAEEGRLLYEQGDLRIEVVELTRLAAIKADEREQKARDFMRAEMRYHRAVEDLKTKQLQIQDHEKKFKEMQQRLKEFAKLYDVIKNERNKIVNQIQTSTQISAEMREKIKILANEMEILRTSVAQKERLLQKTRLRRLNSIVIRDSLRNELAKQMRIEEEMREKRKQQKMEIEKLNNMINHAEEKMVELRNKYEDEVQHRNARGIQLIERNEEVCIFYEKVNIQDTMIREGNVAVQAREEEIRFLKMHEQEEKRGIAVLRKNVPNKRNLEQELVTLQIQLSQCQDRMMEQEKRLEDPNDETRVRFLEGNDMTPAQLKDKIQELETRLAEKEEQLLEKELIFEQVTRLSDRVKKRADSGKDDTLDLAKKVNDIQAKIKDTTRKMMAMVSELSMNQASAMKLQAQVKEQEAQLEQSYIRMEKGEPPSDEIEREWEKMLKIEERKIKDVEQAQMVQYEEDQYTLSEGYKSTAEPRPNAYIPDDELELPIPRPYGAHAPFKPQEPGSTMRHIRKPVPKPIEI